MALTQTEINEVMNQLQPIIAKALNESTSIQQAQANIQQGVTQYVGARYVPLFADPIEWDSTRAYEPLTIVLHQGNSYTTRQYTPAGIEITNEAFWAETGNYNAQVELYRQEVQNYKKDVDKIISIIDTPKSTNTMIAIPLWPELSSHYLIDKEIANAKLANISKAIVCIQINNFNIDNITYCINKLKENNIEPFAIKFHENVNNYYQIVDNIMKQIADVKRVFVYNEFYNSDFANNINTLKSLGYTVGVSYNKNSYIQAYEHNNHDLPDIIGINMYPSPGYSINPNRTNIVEAFENENWFTTTKPIIITETGILPYPCFYYAPELYETDKGYPFNSTVGRTKDYNVMKNYYSAAIQSLNGAYDGVCLWYWEQANEDVAKFIKEIQ